MRPRMWEFIGPFTRYVTRRKAMRLAGLLGAVIVDWLLYWVHRYLIGWFNGYSDTWLAIAMGTLVSDWQLHWVHRYLIGWRTGYTDTWLAGVLCIVICDWLAHWVHCDLIGCVQWWSQQDWQDARMLSPRIINYRADCFTTNGPCTK